MKLTKISIIFTFLLAFAFQVSAQDEKPKIVWGNLQENYERLEDVKPMLINTSKKVAYFNSTYTETAKLFKFDEEEKKWIQSNVFTCGNRSKKEIEDYYSNEFPLELNEEKEITFDKLTWLTLLYGSPGNIFKLDSRKPLRGKFKIQINYWYEISKKYRNMENTKSPEFTLNEKEK